MNSTFGRIAKSLGVNIVFLLLTLGAIYLIVRGVDSLDDTLRRLLRAASLSSQEMRVGDARSQMMLWCIIIFTVSWLSSSIFLVSAEQARPDNRIEGKRRMSLWFVMLIVTFGMIALTAWLTLFHAGVNAVLTFNAFGAALIVGILLNLLAYYFATALAVKRTMRPSVPLGEAMPQFWS